MVQILATGYGPVSDAPAGQSALVARPQGVGSGVILDPSGYIVTNAHVVKGAERIQVVFTKSDRDPAVPLPPAGEQTMLPATLVGLTDYFDLALLKVEATGLPALPLADFRTVTQGQVVLAVGSPLGLDNSVTMGVISAVARPARPESPVVYVQTDAPINPGNSGGALVDVEGRLVGINTFILSQAGGNEGLGFALPAPIVSLAYKSLREKVVVEADGRAISTPSQLDGSLYVHDIKEPMTLGVLREGGKVTLRVHIREEQHQADSLIDPTDPQKSLVPPLGVFAATVTRDMQTTFGNLRLPTGVPVVARTGDGSSAELATGDVIHAVNGTAVADVETLRSLLAALKHGDAVVLQVERQGGLEFVAFDLN